jgi:hypothetical protein
MARLAVVWMEMLWPLDEGAAVPLCVRTVDQGAPDGGFRYPLYPLVQRPACVCCVGEAVLACVKGRLGSTCTPERRAKVGRKGWGEGHGVGPQDSATAPYEARPLPHKVLLAPTLGLPWVEGAIGGPAWRPLHLHLAVVPETCLGLPRAP